MATLAADRVDFAVVGGLAVIFNGYPPLTLDVDILLIFTRMKGRSLEDFRPRLRHLETGGVRIPYLSPADLVFLKEDSWRDKDKLDVLAMREIIARESQ